MKKNNQWLILLLSVLTFNCQAENIDTQHISLLSVSTASMPVKLSDNDHQQLVSNNLINTLTHSLANMSEVNIFGKKYTWKNLAASKLTDLSTTGLNVFQLDISTHAFVKGNFTIEGVEAPLVYLDGQPLSADASSDGKKYSLTLHNADHQLMVVADKITDWQEVKFDWSSQSTSTVTFTLNNNKKRLQAQQMFDSEVVSNIQLSPDGELLLWKRTGFSPAGEDKSHSISELINTRNKQVVYRWQAMSPQNTSWNPDSTQLAFTHENNIYLLNRDGFAMTTIASDIADIRSLDWFDQDTLLISWFKPEKKPHEFTKRYRSLEDRWSYWRGQSQLYLVDVHSGYIQQLSKNKLASDLLDFDAKQNKILLVRSPIDYQQPAHYISHLIELDLTSNEEKLIGKFRTLNSAAYSKHGIVITAGPSFVDASGSQLADGIPANEYDSQLYLLKSDKSIQALSKSFKPSIGSFSVMHNGNIILSALDGDKTALFEYNFKTEKFKAIKTTLENIEDFSISNEKSARLVYKGTTATSPQKTYFAQLGKSKHQLLADTLQDSYADTQLIELKDWDYVTKKGHEIDGRYYLPANFDASKKYPVLIYYYGGTVPVGRAFTGRWPFSLWASQGYVVYVLQPSGSVGYGQEFSAKHVNAWGLETADDIIESTQAFVQAHDFVDGTKLGNLGASYGGFMTMYLATKTDMFRASISHAGISNLTSYWGHGWWGYSYSGVASKGSFPWNNPQLYTQQSPVFSADKVTTPILLLHGDADTNVPVGESHQMYTALKLLDKEVEFIEFQGDDHHINIRSHRLRWWDTIIAYFDKELKDQPDWWNDMYPAAKD